MSDDDVRDILARAAREHSPDSARIRARFDRGRAEHLAGQRAQRRCLPGAEVIALRPSAAAVGRTGRRSWLLPVTWAVAAACAVTTFAVATGGLPGDSEETAVSSTGAADVTDLLNPTTTAPPTRSAVDPTAPLPDPPATSAAGTPKPPHSAAVTRPTATGGPGPATTGSAAGGTDRCDNGARLVDGPYVIANNQWNAEAGTGRQCVRLIGADGSATAWSAQWAWSGAPGTLKGYTSKAYPSVVRGWHWEWGVPDRTFPVALNSGRELRTHWRYRVEPVGSARVDVSTILTLHRGAPGGPRDVPDAEVRVIFSTLGVQAAPRSPGTRTVMVPGAGAFDVNRDGPVWTLTAAGATGRRTADVNLDLLAVTRALAPLGLDQTLAVSGVVAGADVGTGSARLDTASYRLTVR